MPARGRGDPGEGAAAGAVARTGAVFKTPKPLARGGAAWSVSAGSQAFLDRL